ncbi:MAG: hypothetical protein COU09_02465 [Candidatus Harrisonbacteria bacterium CG10_big_fil_rev_8_21_14_0_10_44_23]|uniref:Uncharacterized protein n=1 Tax=Candidatus Harrisonbacteria bacterium CG10_big_fil_rev_8_21_14_0_10_44_23 TaxID=1974585 RepID=A0A2H0URL2_9BACT|nr:MAG: hypothetical protein COU09_02465 [Candidatus Harrisonbacteria bacterium CG10_big_fil_rev_8_21_14_0_10_44_23]
MVTAGGEHWVFNAYASDAKQIMALILELDLTPGYHVPFEETSQFDVDFCLGRMANPDWCVDYEED